MATQSVMSESQARRQVEMGRIWLAGAASMVVAVVVNLMALVGLRAVLALPADFPPLQAGAIAFLTAVGVLAAVGVYAGLARFSANPVGVFRVVAWVALVVSIGPNLALMVNPSAIPFPFPGASGLAFGVLIVFHVLAALVCIFLLPRMTVRK